MLWKEECSLTYTDTGLWKRSLASRENDPLAAYRERLRSSYESIRAKVSLLVSEIHRDLPDFTVHDISHLDRLWEVADLIAGADFTVNPLEAYVLGGAILLHDAGMSVSAFPDRLNAIRKSTVWADTKAALGRQQRLTKTFGELQSKHADDERTILPIVLRLLHAQQAEVLATAAWIGIDRSASEFLIEDTELRSSCGSIIGKIAHSHWWSSDELASRLGVIRGAPGFMPQGWELDPLKVACLLRLSDAAHIDGSRAPRFLAAIRGMQPSSIQHWTAQAKLNRPRVSGSALEFSSHSAFGINDPTKAWGTG